MTHQKGIHHITGMSGDAQQNVDFYVKKLGMRMVKKSVNQDDPGTYHLFYGNKSGSPGSGLTFFPWPMARQGKSGVGEAIIVSFKVPASSLNFWVKHFSEKGIEFDGPFDRFGMETIRFQDPDRLKLELVFDENVSKIDGWSESTLPSKHGIRGFHGTTLRLKDYKATAEVLKKVFSFKEKNVEGNGKLYKTEADLGNNVVIEEAEPKPSANGRGIIHHVAFRAENDEELSSLRKKVLELGLRPTEIIDRHWFHSVYFRSPGGVLFEIATDGPGYDVDEDAEELGQKLILPPWLETRRSQIERRLPELNY